VLGNTPQATAYGRQIVGWRLSVLSRRGISRKVGPGGFSERTVDGGAYEISVRLGRASKRHNTDDRDPAAFMTPMLERRLLDRICWNGIC
jgi:hypothetical protein